MKKIVIFTLFIFFSVMGGDFELLPRTISPRQLDYRTWGDDIDMHGTASFAPFGPDLIPLYMYSATADETLPTIDYQDFDTEADLDALLSSTHTAVQDDGPAHTLGIIPANDITMHIDESDDTESSSTQSSKKRSRPEASETTTDTWCGTCRMHVKEKLRRHIQSATHKKVLELRAQGKDVVGVNTKGKFYIVMPEKEAQEYNKNKKQFQEMLQDKNVWAYDAENEYYTCILCNTPCTTHQMVRRHIATYKHNDALDALKHRLSKKRTNKREAEALPSGDYQEFDSMMPSTKRITYIPLQDDGPAHTFDLLSPSLQYDSALSTTSSATTIDYASSSTAPSYDDLDQGPQSVLATQSAIDSENEALPAPCLTQGTNDIVAHIGSSRKTMTPEKAQEYNKKAQLVQEALQDKSVWQQSKDNRYKCLRCNSSYLRGIVNIYMHICSKTHRNTLGLEQYVAHTCPTCELEFHSELSLQSHETADFHLKIKELLARGIPAVAVPVGGTHYEAMTVEEAQEHHKENEQFKAELRDKRVWKYDTKNNSHTCILCHTPCVDNGKIHQHRKSKKHQDTLALFYAQTVEEEI